MSKKEADSKHPAKDRKETFFNKTYQEEYPYCFGKLETVFPMAEDGLRHTPDSCMVCRYKTECLRAALKRNDGLKVQAEKVDRAYASGMMGFFERWSRKKTLDRQMKKKK